MSNGSYSFNVSVSDLKSYSVKIKAISKDYTSNSGFSKELKINIIFDCRVDVISR